jgi:hypothetical protein
LRGANQSLGIFSSAVAWSPGASAVPSAPGRPVAPVAGAAPAGPVPCASVPPSSAAESASVTGVRTTTGGIGREPGMLIRIRVVSVVSVLRSSGRAAERPVSGPPSDTIGVP